MFLFTAGTKANRQELQELTTIIPRSYQGQPAANSMRRISEINTELVRELTAELCRLEDLNELLVENAKI